MNNLKEEILTKISEQTICQRYFGKYYPNNIVEPNLGIAPPYDKRTKKTFNLYEKNNRIRWRDEGINQRGDLFRLIQKTYRLNYQETLTMIDYDFKLGLIKNNRKFSEYEHITLTDETIYFLDGEATTASLKLEKAINKVILKGYEINSSKKNLYQSFEALGIDKTMVDEYELFELNYGKVTMPKFSFYIRSTEENPVFAYRYSKQIKIVNPSVQGGFRRFTHIGRKGSKYIFGLKQLKRKKSSIKKLFLVTNEIDAIIFTANGFDAVCVCGGDTILTKGLLKQLSFAQKVIFLNNGKEEELNIAKVLKQKFNIPSINYQSLIKNGATNAFI